MPVGLIRLTVNDLALEDQTTQKLSMHTIHTVTANLAYLNS